MNTRSYEFPTSNESKDMLVVEDKTFNNEHPLRNTHLAPTAYL